MGRQTGTERPLRIRLDRMRKESLLDQARDQIISGLHAGLLRRGERLPALRRVATLSGLNVKTVMRLYASLQREGLLEIRKGSGAFVTVQEPDELEPAQAAGVGRFLHRHLDEASDMNITPGAYATLVQHLVTRCSLEGKAVAVLECNEEQTHLYAREIKDRIGVEAHPILLADLPDRATASLVRSTSILAVTDFHFREATQIARRLGKTLVRLRLRRDFLPALMGAARRGRLTMIVSNTSFVPAFRRAIGALGLERKHLDRISVVAGSDAAAVRRAIAEAAFIYISPLCERETRSLVPRGKSLLIFDHHIADDSVEELESWLLLSSPETP